MATRNIVPRANGEGNIGTAAKNWLKGWFQSLFVSGNLTDGTYNASVADTSDAISKKHTSNTDTTTLPSTGLANQTGQGTIITGVTFGETVAIGDPLYCKSDGSFWKADANGSGTYPVDAISLSASSSTGNILLRGIIRNDSWSSWTVGGVIYLSITAGLTQSQPTATNDVIQVLGKAIAAKVILFNPSPDYITHT